jgi:hypothetical protein
MADPEGNAESLTDISPEPGCVVDEDVNNCTLERNFRLEYSLAVLCS